MKQPTLKQERAAIDTLANLGRKKPKTKKQILLDAGYGPGIAKNPDIVIESKGFKELLEQYLPDSKLAKVHSEGLEANKIISANITYGEADEKTNDFIEVPDYTARKGYLELAYKVKGKIAPDPTPPPTSNTYNLFYQPTFQQSVKAFEQDIKNLIASEHEPTQEN